MKRAWEIICLVAQVTGCVGVATFFIWAIWREAPQVFRSFVYGVQQLGGLIANWKDLMLSAFAAVTCWLAVEALSSRKEALNSEINESLKNDPEARRRCNKKELAMVGVLLLMTLYLVVAIFCAAVTVRIIFLSIQGERVYWHNAIRW